MTDTLSIQSQLLTREFFSPVLNRSWRYSVYLPSVEPSARLPTLHLLHGRGGDERSWATEGNIQSLLDTEIRAGRLPPLLAVMLDGGSGWYVGPVEEAFLTDLLPHIAASFPTDERREARALAGYSMGGYGALRFALLRPDLFASAALLSPAIYDIAPPAESTTLRNLAFGTPFDHARWRALNYPALLANFAGQQPRFFVATGDADDPHSDPQANTEVQAALLHARLRGRGFASHLRILPGGHDWDVWRPALLEGLRLLI